MERKWKELKYKRIKQKVEHLEKDRKFFRKLKSDCVKNQKFEKAAEYRSMELDLTIKIDNIWRENGNDVKDKLPNQSDRYWGYVEEITDLGVSHFQDNVYYDFEDIKKKEITEEGRKNIINIIPKSYKVEPTIIKEYYKIYGGYPFVTLDDTDHIKYENY